MLNNSWLHFGHHSKLLFNFYCYFWGIGADGSRCFGPPVFFDIIQFFGQCLISFFHLSPNISKCLFPVEFVCISSVDWSRNPKKKSYWMPQKEWKIQVPLMGFKKSLVPCVHYFAVLLVTVAIQKAAFPLLKFTLFFFSIALHIFPCCLHLHCEKTRQTWRMVKVKCQTVRL